MKLQGNHAETAQLLGVTGEALRKMVRDRGCPVLKRGIAGGATLFDWPAVVAWRVQDAGSGRGALTDARTKLAKAQAAKVESENAQRAGYLVDIREVERAWERLILIFRNRMLSLPTVLAPELVGTTDEHVAKSLLDREMRQALEDLAAHDPATGQSQRGKERPNGQDKANTNTPGAKRRARQRARA